MEEGTSKRKYMRHPSDIPIQYEVQYRSDGLKAITNISKGGLCFVSDENLPVGAIIRIDLEMGDMAAEIEGQVVWSSKKDLFYEVGVEFPQDADVFYFRLIEQLCSIAHYRNEVKEKEGRELTSEDAAREWIEKYAAEYPE